MNTRIIPIAKYTACFKALSDKTRLRIFYILSKLNKELAVCEIMDATAESQYNISRHLQILKHAELIKENKKGRWVLYSINDDHDIVPQLVHTVLALKSVYFKEDIQRAKARLKKRCKGKIVFCINKPLPEKFHE